MAAPIFTDSDGQKHAVRAEEPASVALLLGTVGARVETAGIEQGILRLTLSDGSEIRCEPQEAVEAWQIVGGVPEHFVVCMPGGEVAVWTD